MASKSRFRDIKSLWEFEKVSAIGIKPSNFVGHKDIGYLIELIEDQQKEIQYYKNKLNKYERVE